MPRTIHAALAALLLAGPALAQGDAVTSGGDLFVSGVSARSTAEAERDLFTAGARVRVSGPVAGDLHAVGFDVDVAGTTGGDLYAAGSDVSIEAPVGEDVTATAGSLALMRGASVAGNARLTGGTVTVEGPIAGSLLVAGGDVLLDAPVEGDVTVAAGALAFGPEARIGGRLLHAGPEPAEVPATVVPSDRVTFDRMSRPEVLREAGEGWRPPEAPGPGPWTVAGGLAATLGALMVLGAVLLAFAPRTVASMRRRATARPWLCLLLGALGLSALMGLVPVSAMTLVGLPLLPVVVLAIVLAWILGYLLGAYAVAMRVAEALGAGAAPPVWLRLAVLALAVVVAASLNFVPVLGWLANLALILLGIGALVAAILERTVVDPDPEWYDDVGSART